MKWEESAKNVLEKLGFSERRKTISRAEAAALKAGRDIVTIGDVRQKNHVYIKNYTHVSDGYRLDACSGSGSCPNRAHSHAEDGGMQLVKRLKKLLDDENPGDFLRRSVEGPVRPHHLFSIAVADCPNACSRPQISDIGIIAAASPVLTEHACIMCGACENACRESAVTVDTSRQTPVIDYDLCMFCGGCIAVCPTGKTIAGQTGYRVMIGGKLGRHPRLATELPGIYDAKTVFLIVKWCVDEYREKSTRGKRFASIVAEEQNVLTARLNKHIKKILS